jgi:SAM-dependent methyltransferase
MHRTIDYYNINAEKFDELTKNIDMSAVCETFLKYIPTTADILDAGCGSGRDSIYFLDRGYQVSAFDASEKMAALASQLTGLDVKVNTFLEMQYKEDFDGIWAQSSLLHVPYEETEEVYTLLHKALKPEGIFYGSYKYGYEPLSTEERDFWLMDEERAAGYLQGKFTILEMWTREARTNMDACPYKKWLNFVARKI